MSWPPYHDLNEAGGWYAHGSNGSLSYSLVNGVLRSGYMPIYRTLLAGRRHSISISRPNNYKSLLVDGKQLVLPYWEILYPTIDTAGHFACYGKRNDSCYRIVDGREAGSLLFRNGVRTHAWPLYISPTGVSVHLFQYNDSVWLYRGDSLLTPPFARKGRPLSVNKNGGDLLPPWGRNRNENEAHPLIYLAIDSAGYFLWRGTLSRPMLPASSITRGSYRGPGNIVAGSESDDAFFAIQRTGARKYRINASNAVYQDFEGPEEILSRAVFLEECRLVFYGLCGSELYQYVLSW